MEGGKGGGGGRGGGGSGGVGRGGGGGRRGRSGGRFWEAGAATGLSGKVCKVCLQTPLRAGSASSMKKMRAPPPLRALWRAFVGGLKGGKKGGFTSDSSNTPLGRRTPKP